MLIFLVVLITLILLIRFKILFFTKIFNFLNKNETFNDHPDIKNFIFSLTLLVALNSFLGIFFKSTFHSQNIISIFYAIFILVYGLLLAVKKYKLKFYKIFLLSDGFLGYFLLPLKIILVLTKPFLICFSRIYIAGLIKHSLLKVIKINSQTILGFFIGNIILLIEIMSIVISIDLFNQLVTNFFSDIYNH